ncbi:MAG TPA: ATP-grasp domain-containing protein [Streptosporangiaceae bacterium]|nr:ATP-grasp domain-containing protein [Streptosporangiaceae bacterium]
MKPAGKPVLVLISTGPRLYREYLLRSIAARYRIHLLTGSDPAWALPYLDGVVVLPDMGTDAVVSAAQRLAAQLPVAGVLTWAEDHTVDSARAAAALGLPGPSAAAALACRDKLATRSALAAHGVPQPEFADVSDVDEAQTAAAKIGYPVVLKPRAGVASEGVVKVDDPTQLAEEFPASRDVPAPDVPLSSQAVLVEEYLTGPEISVDSVVQGGRVTPVFVARKEIGFAPYFEETGHLVSSGDPLLTDSGLLGVLARVHAALGYTDGCTHAELKLTPDGPKLIEVNGRLGGDLIPYLGMRATGIDPGLAAAAVACGQPPDLSPRAEGVAGIRFFYPPWPRTLISSVGFDLTCLPAAGLDLLDLLAPLVDAGATVSQPGRGLMDGRIALATSVAPTEQECRSALDHAQAALSCTWSPAVPDT